MKKDPSLILSKRYATAFLNVFINELSREDIAVIEHVSNFLHNNPRILFFLKISVIPDNKKREIVTQWLKEENVPLIINTLVELLISEKRLSLLGAVLSEIAVLYKERNNIMELTVRSSHALSKYQQEKIEQFCAHKVAQKKLEYTYVRDPLLQIGVAVESNTIRWERSLRKLLQEIANSRPL